MLNAQVLTIHGVAQVFSNKLEAAEENLKNALKQMEKLGLEMEVGTMGGDVIFLRCKALFFTRFSSARRVLSR